ncbi:MAG: hypothetical protein HFG28_12090 [Eubacterium sp.]|nr:hypothetical protein [Eubacterium sp.]
MNCFRMIVPGMIIGYEKLLLLKDMIILVMQKPLLGSGMNGADYEKGCYV